MKIRCRIIKKHYMQIAYNLISLKYMEFCHAELYVKLYVNMCKF